VSITGDDFIQCTSCMGGLFLLANSTNTNDLPTNFGFCVPDCRRAHASYVNDVTTGKCMCKFFHYFQGAETIAKAAIAKMDAKTASR